MDMQGSRVLAATREQAWDALNDPEVLKACIPGCEKVERTGEDSYALGMAVKVGPVAARFSGRIQLQDMQPPERYTLVFDGQGGAAGFGKGTAQVQLAPVEGGTELSYTVQAQVGGKIAQVGQRLVDGVAKQMAEQFFQRFENLLRERHPAPAVAEGAPAATAPASAAPAAGGGVPTWVWVLIALAIAGAGAWLLR
jgi:carbon monoxide dehydrogenase subunit G